MCLSSKQLPRHHCFVNFPLDWNDDPQWLIHRDCKNELFNSDVRCFATSQRHLFERALVLPPPYRIIFSSFLFFLLPPTLIQSLASSRHAGAPLSDHFLLVSCVTHTNVRSIFLIAPQWWFQFMAVHPFVPSCPCFAAMCARHSIAAAKRCSSRTFFEEGISSRASEALLWLLAGTRFWFPVSAASSSSSSS